MPRLAPLQATNRAEVKGQSCNTETIDGANIPLTLRGAERSSMQGERETRELGDEVVFLSLFHYPRPCSGRSQR